MRDARRATERDVDVAAIGDALGAAPVGVRTLSAARVAAAVHADRVAQDRARGRRDRARGSSADEGVTVEERLMLLEAWA